MAHRAGFILLLIALPLAFAYPPGLITITPLEYKDFGNASLPKFDGLVIKIDCNAAAIKAHAASSGQPVAAAMAYLKYADYATPLLSSGPTDASGDVSNRVPSGNISHMSGLFILTVEKSGYQRREVHFTVGDCFYVPPPTEPGPSAANPVQPVPPLPPQQNATPPASPPANGSQQNATGNNWSGNQIGNLNGNATGNGTGNQTGNGGANPSACPLPLALFAALGVLVLVQFLPEK